MSTSTFSPIAIVGRGCVLPGALSVAELDALVLGGRDVVTGPPPGVWGVHPQTVRNKDGVDGTWTDRGGYVRDFVDRFDPSGLNLGAQELAACSEGERWLLSAAQQALAEGAAVDRAATGVVIGNLSFPTREMSEFAERCWLGDGLADAAGIPVRPARSRFVSGLPAQTVASAHGLGGPTLALDAACASALYAIGHACALLQAGDARAVLAGAVNQADDLLVHIGFCALKALSKSGRSRPFHRDADGLIPASGAGLVLLKRWEDAVADGDTIFAVIRGVGLSNDGRGRGFLAPSAAGQQRAMKQAYRQSGLTPADIGLVECHATGTQLGDATEIMSTAAVFAGCEDVVIGSLKSNMGHLITAAGVAGVLKSIASIRRRTLPPTLHADQPTAALSNTPFVTLERAAAWDDDRPLRAAVSAFGFGGNNAHLILEDPSLTTAHTATPTRRQPLAIVGVGCALGPANSLGEVLDDLAKNPEFRGESRQVGVSLGGLRAPPNDLKSALPQQLAMLQVARDALGMLDGLNPDQTSVIVGMGCDPEVSRHAMRWRLPARARRLDVDAASWLATSRDAIVPKLDAAALLGCMPNIPANRINHHLGISGPSMTVSAEQLSGPVALQVASHLLRNGQAELAVAGAVDFTSDVHKAALQALDIDTPTGDAAIAFLVTTPSIAAEKQWPILATVQPTDPPSAPTTNSTKRKLKQIYGTAHAAGGMTDLLEALVDVQGAPDRTHTLVLAGIPQRSQTWHVRGGAAPLPRSHSHTGPRLFVASHAQSPAYPPLPPRRPPAPRATPPKSSAMPPRPGAQPTPPLPAVAPAKTPVSRTNRASDALEQRPGFAVDPTPLFALLQQQAAQLATSHAHFAHVSQAGHRAYLANQQQATSALLQSHAQWPTDPGQRDLPPPPTSASEVSTTSIVGPALTRADLEVHASGRISTIFGPEFAGQDDFERQVRMPCPPLLLADRVLGIEGQPRSMGKGRIWTETDVRTDSWYLHDGRLPAGVMIEAGQADLVLISWLGIDFENRGERVYRLLGCDLTYSGGLLQPGDTIRYEITCDGHARQGNIGLFFFHYDGRVDGSLRIQVRNGQAGFFTDEDLATSKGILWRPENAEPTPDPQLDPPPCPTTRTALTARELGLFAKGDAAGCFGDSHDLARTHTRPPTIADGKLLLLEEVTDLRFDGGPWKRGYLRAIDRITPSDWFFDGHFHNDPCMPGTLMFEGCMQAMATYMAAMGLTLPRDGWRFEPVPDVSYPLRCRGQVLPTSDLLVYEVFVDEVIAAPIPTLWADILCTIDGLPAFWCRRMGLQLSPGWPLDDPNFRTEAASRPWSQVIAQTPEFGDVAQLEGIPLDYQAMMATAWGRPSDAFGPMYRPFDNGRRVARLPGPPYHFMSRVTHVDQPPGQVEAGVTVQLAWDIPPDGFFFAADASGYMPFCVFLEAALQPCGWLASYVGCATTVDSPLFFRNLDGTGTWTSEIGPLDGTLHTTATLTNISASAGMILVSFDVSCALNGTEIYSLQTGFGFFPGRALENQAGLPRQPRWTELLTRRGQSTRSLLAPTDALFTHAPMLPSPVGEPSLWMLHRLTLAEKSADGLGSWRAEHDVDAGAWYFKAHFFQDPVQPGSLGLEALSQLLRVAMRDLELGAGMTRPRFRAATGQPLTWKYRGQVLPTDERVMVALELTSVVRGADFVRATADGSLWVDGRRIYEAIGMTMDIVESTDA